MTIPVLVALMFTIVQAAMWWYCGQLARTAAQDAARAARAYGSSAAAGQLSGLHYLYSVEGGGHVLQSPHISVQRTATTVTVTVTGEAVSLVPGLSRHITAISRGPVERYVPYGGAP